MNNDDSAEKAAWHRTLPRKRMAAGWVVQNKAGEFLILKPSHKDYWGLPGGVVESEESPWHACQREVKEELGIDIDPGRLLCVDYCPSQPGYTESLQFLFYGGVLTSTTMESIRLNADGSDELDAYQWAPLKQAIMMLGERVARRLSACADHLDRGGLFLIDQRPPDKSVFAKA